MRITSKQLRQIIREELIREMDDGPGEFPGYGQEGDQYPLMRSLDLGEVADSMIHAWGYEDILVMVDILRKTNFRSSPQALEDLDSAQELFDDLLSPFGLTADPEDRRLTPRESKWIAGLLGEIQRRAKVMIKLDDERQLTKYND
jgi:hypothetical protein